MKSNFTNITTESPQPQIVPHLVLAKCLHKYTLYSMLITFLDFDKPSLYGFASKCICMHIYLYRFAKSDTHLYYQKRYQPPMPCYQYVVQTFSENNIEHERRSCTCKTQLGWGVERKVDWPVAARAKSLNECSVTSRSFRLPFSGWWWNCGVMTR